MEWVVIVHPLAADELDLLPVREQKAVENAMNKLEQLGPGLPFPHSSAIQGADRIRELRPRGSNCRWRAFYRHIGEAFVVAAIGPEAHVKPRDFDKAVHAAQQRLNEVEAGS